MRRTATVGVVIPVHDEEELLPRALEAVARSLQAPGLGCLDTHVAVVLDACHDNSPSIARSWAAGAPPGTTVHLVETADARVGAARRAGCEAILGAVGSRSTAKVWLATTDSDSEVPAAWLARQIDAHERGSDVWTGTVEVVDWSGRPPSLAGAWACLYSAEEHPVHGTSLGINGAMYRRSGGFAPLATAEDRGLHAAALACGAVSHHDRTVPVRTSARRAGRAPDGFAAALGRLEAGVPSAAQALSFAAASPAPSPVAPSRSRRSSSAASIAP